MSVQYVNFPYALPVKFYKNTETPGGHLDDDWAYARIKSFEQARRYPQRWQVGDTTKLQISSTIPPDSLKVYSCAGVLLTSIAWAEVLTWSGFKVYELTLTLDAQINKTVYLYQKVELMDTVFEAISEPIQIKTAWPNTNVFEYTNSRNDFGLWYIGAAGAALGTKFRFRIEAGIMDYEPDGDTADFIDETHNGELLSATPFDKFKLYIGDAAGVPDWCLKILNFIVLHDNWKFEIKNNDAKQYVKQGKWDITRSKGWALYGAAIDIIPATNLYALQLNATTIEPGIVTGFMLQTGFWGTSVEEINVEEINIIE